MPAEHSSELSPTHHIDALLEEYAATTLSHEDVASSKEAGLAALRLLQDVVWAEHCETVLPGRELAWMSVIAGLRDVVPTRFYQRRSDYGLGGVWELAALRKTGTTALQLTTTVELTSYAELPSELAQAKRYLKEPRSGRKCPEELLGVRAEGRVRKSLPLDRLNVAYDAACHDELLDTAKELKASTVVSALGSSVKPRQLYVADLWVNWHDPNERDFYLKPEHAYAILKDGPHESGQELDQEAVIDFLRRHARGDERWQKRYQNLAAIGEVLAESSSL